MLEIDNTVLLVIDVQEKLLPVMHEKEKLVGNMQNLIHGMQVLEIPIILTEQYPRGLGKTVTEISELLTGVAPLAKTSFSCYGDAEFKNRLDACSRKQILVCGIECHVCVYQTAMDLKQAGYEVQVVADAVSSRTAENRETGLNLMRQMGITVTSSETVLFELLKIAEGEKFKAISRIFK
jgi:nicotinamidase-related amidase